MIILQEMYWDNMFSYGEANYISFNSNPLSQIIGLNGHGKSSIALILEEILYNKNSKGIKKGDILNRNIKAKSYSAELLFLSNGDEYRISITRGSTQKVNLFKNGVDISAHTATGTYKLIEDIMGMDHSTFAQIIYQSSATSLEFLTATDSNRKRFLIDLFTLSHYTDPLVNIKDVVKALELESSSLDGSVKSIDAMLKENSLVNTTYLEVSEPLPQPTSILTEISNLKQELRNIEATNKSIIQNNKYKELLDNIKIPLQRPRPKDTVADLNKLVIELTKTSTDALSFVANIKKLGSKCPTCKQSVNTAINDTLVAEATVKSEDSSKRVLELKKEIAEQTLALRQWESEQALIRQYEEYHSLYNPSISSVLLDKDTIQKEIQSLEKSANTILDSIKKTLEQNKLAVAHNAKIDLILSQNESLVAKRATNIERLKTVNKQLALNSILIKTFSPSGLVAYKIENLVKTLEEETNKYLVELSDGRFQLLFKMSASDKLNVVISDNGNDIEINSLSGGERARVNTAALLGIRKLLQSLSSNKINLLFLDETIDNLDKLGKEKLVEMLLEEPLLNTFLVSHNFTHPLLQRINVVKENEISRIELDG